MAFQIRVAVFGLMMIVLAVSQTTFCCFPSFTARGDPDAHTNVLNLLLLLLGSIKPARDVLITPLPRV